MDVFHIDDTFVALDDTKRAWPLPVTADFWDALRNGKLGTFSRMVSFFAFDRDWTTWEKHPAGEELVMLLEGDVVLLLEQSGRETEVRLSRPGSYVLVPRDTWHTARVHAPCRMLFVTPGEGTANRPA